MLIVWRLFNNPEVLLGSPLLLDIRFLGLLRGKLSSAALLGGILTPSSLCPRETAARKQTPTPAAPPALLHELPAQPYLAKICDGVF